MTQIMRSPPHCFPSSSSSNITIHPSHNDDTLHQHHTFLDFSRRNNSCTNCTEEEEESVLTVFFTVFRKSLVGCRSSVEEHLIMDIGRPTDVRHVAHVTFDRFDGFLGLPVEFEPEVPRKPPSASTRVFGVSTDSMQLSFDSRNNCVPTILLMMQKRLYSQGGLQLEGIFRINPENGQEEYVREQLNNGVIPENIDVHCLAGLIKAWFRELPKGILDTLSYDDVMQAQSEDECAQLVTLLPPTESALLNWSINLMADVAQLENLNKMNARNIAMVFAPNMTQMSDPLTALMYAVQVMNFLKTLVIKTLRERQDCTIQTGPVTQLDEPSDEDDRYMNSKQSFPEAEEISEEEEENVASEPQTNRSDDSESRTRNETRVLFRPVENITEYVPHLSRSRKIKNWQPSDSNTVKKGSRQHVNNSQTGD